MSAPRSRPSQRIEPGVSLRRATGAWVLQAGGFAVEVRGLVPRTCFRGSGGDGGEVLTIFAQIEPKGPDSNERLLLRLPE